MEDGRADRCAAAEAAELPAPARNSAAADAAHRTIHVSIG